MVNAAEVASFIAAVTDWEGFAASVATKVLHKKRPKLIPILDNEAIFGAYMNLKWPEKAGINRQRLREGTSRGTTPICSSTPSASHSPCNKPIGADP
jgi:formate dehydrogenase maturation protein FdhE